MSDTLRICGIVSLSDYIYQFTTHASNVKAIMSDEVYNIQQAAKYQNCKVIYYTYIHTLDEDTANTEKRIRIGFSNKDNSVDQTRSFTGIARIFNPASENIWKQGNIIINKKDTVIYPNQWIMSEIDFNTKQITIKSNFNSYTSSSVSSNQRFHIFVIKIQTNIEIHKEIKCPIKPYFIETGNETNICDCGIYNCLICSGNICGSCYPDQQLFGDGICRCNTKNCLKCSSQTTCDSIYTALCPTEMKLDTNNNRCIPICSANQYLSEDSFSCVTDCEGDAVKDTTTMTCVETCPIFYKKDLTKDLCIEQTPATCPQGYIKIQDKCRLVCPVGQYIDLSLTNCVAQCPSNSYIDNLNVQCVTECPKEFQPHSDLERCVPVCPKNTIRSDDGLACIPCSSFPSIKGLEQQCDSICGDNQVTGSEQCDDGNSIDGDCCSSKCQIEKTCDKNCKVYTKDKQCQICNIDYTNYNQRCVLDCPTRYYLKQDTEQNNCYECPSACKECVYLTKKIVCEACLAGYYQSNGECNLCHSSCQECFGPLENNCLKCKKNQILTSTNKCQPNQCRPGTFYSIGTQSCQTCYKTCKTCNNQFQNSCGSCYVNYQLAGGNCIYCQSEYNNLIKTARGYVCKEKCGIGLRISSQKECDDGNQENNDGCSSICKIESGWECQGGGIDQMDTCRKKGLPMFSIEQREQHTTKIYLKFSRPMKLENITEFQNDIILSIIDRTNIQTIIINYNLTLYQSENGYPVEFIIDFEIQQSIKPNSICLVEIKNYNLKYDIWNNSLYNQQVQTNISEIFISSQSIQVLTQQAKDVQLNSRASIMSLVTVISCLSGVSLFGQNALLKYFIAADQRLKILVLYNVTLPQQIIDTIANQKFQILSSVTPNLIKSYDSEYPKFKGFERYSYANFTGFFMSDCNDTLNLLLCVLMLAVIFKSLNLCINPSYTLKENKYYSTLMVYKSFSNIYLTIYQNFYDLVFAITLQAYLALRKYSEIKYYRQGRDDIIAIVLFSIMLAFPIIYAIQCLQKTQKYSSSFINNNFHINKQELLSYKEQYKIDKIIKYYGILNTKKLNLAFGYSIFAMYKVIIECILLNFFQLYPRIQLIGTIVFSVVNIFTLIFFKIFNRHFDNLFEILKEMILLSSYVILFIILLDTESSIRLKEDTRAKYLDTLVLVSIIFLIISFLPLIAQLIDFTWKLFKWIKSKF